MLYNRGSQTEPEEKGERRYEIRSAMTTLINACRVMPMRAASLSIFDTIQAGKSTVHFLYIFAKGSEHRLPYRMAERPMTCCAREARAMADAPPPPKNADAPAMSDISQLVSRLPAVRLR